MMSESLLVGFARADISPTLCSVPLGGFSATEFRLSGVIGDPLYANAVALRSGEETLVYLSTDLLGIPKNHVAEFREAIAEKTGLPKDRIFITASHTHSGPDPRSEIPAAVRYRTEQLIPALCNAAYRSLADLKPAKLSYGSIEVGNPACRMNFVRHYYVVETEKKDSYTKEDLQFAGFTHPKLKEKGKYCYVGHTADPDPMLHIMRFSRDGADDVMLVNFTAHATIVGTNKSPLVSSDWPGAFVQRMEEVFPGTKCAFLQGCAGNVVPGTRIESEGVPGLTIAPMRDHHAYASVLAGYAYRLLQKDGLKDSESTTISVRQKKMSCICDHSHDHLLPKAQEALAVFKKEGHTPAAREHCYSFGFGSIYECIGIEKHAGLPESEELELNAIRIGDCAITTFPCEAFSSSGERVKAASPFAMTIANAYSCGYHSYMPTIDAPEECYENIQMLYKPGTAEAIEAELSEMLNQMY